MVDELKKKTGGLLEGYCAGMVWVHMSPLRKLSLQINIKFFWLMAFILTFINKTFLSFWKWSQMPWKPWHHGVNYTVIQNKKRQYTKDQIGSYTETFNHYKSNPIQLTQKSISKEWTQIFHDHFFYSWDHVFKWILWPCWK